MSESFSDLQILATRKDVKLTWKSEKTNTDYYIAFMVKNDLSVFRKYKRGNSCADWVKLKLATIFKQEQTMEEWLSDYENTAEL